MNISLIAYFMFWWLLAIIIMVSSNYLIRLAEVKSSKN